MKTTEDYLLPRYWPELQQALQDMKERVTGGLIGNGQPLPFDLARLELHEALPHFLQARLTIDDKSKEWMVCVMTNWVMRQVIDWPDYSGNPMRPVRADDYGDPGKATVNCPDLWASTTDYGRRRRRQLDWVIDAATHCPR